MSYDNRRPEWQEERGERYGNRRKQVADLKVRQRRNDRAKRNAEKRGEMREQF